MQENYNLQASHIEQLRREQTRLELDHYLDNRVTRKFDLHILPWLFGIWYVGCIPQDPILLTGPQVLHVHFTEATLEMQRLTG